jgi:hypothetical protein
MTQTKIEGKFYPLQHEEWLRACQELATNHHFFCSQTELNKVAVEVTCLDFDISVTLEEV